ncbi:MAG: hypothetical protein IPG93_22855 [Burkholderiales bacterium]|nr:hypothetical protein [Burkholderiales bacterium]
MNASFVRRTVTDYIGIVNAIGDHLTDNAHYPLAAWPDKVPKPDELRQSAERLRVLSVESQNRDANKIRERNDLRAEIDGMLDEVRAFVEMAAHGDEAALRSTGFELRQTRATAAGPEPLGAPTDLRLKHGRESGTLDVHVRALAGASSYDVAIAIGETVTEADWRHAAVFSTSMHMLLQDLEPGKYVWIRVRGVNSAGYGLWTPPQRMMVI